MATSDNYFLQPLEAVQATAQPVSILDVYGQKQKDQTVIFPIDKKSSAKTFSIKAFNIMTFGVMTFTIKTFSITVFPRQRNSLPTTLKSKLLMSVFCHKSFKMFAIVLNMRNEMSMSISLIIGSNHH